MDYRNNNFKEKFFSASKVLKTNFDEITSLKIRELLNDYSEYHRLLERLALDGIAITPINGNFQGKAYLVSNVEEQAIIVEHETGLEILYISSSIATFLGLIPAIIQAWKYLRKKIRGNKYDNMESDYIEDRKAEIRYFNKNGELIEEKQSLFIERHNNLKDYHLSNDVLRKLGLILQEQSERISKLEKELKNLNEKYVKKDEVKKSSSIKRKGTDK